MRKIALCLCAMALVAPHHAMALSTADKRVVDKLITAHNNCYRNKSGAADIGRLLTFLRTIRNSNELGPAERNIINLASPVVSTCEKWPSTRWTQIANSLPAAD